MADKPLTVLIGADTYPPDINGAAQFSSRLAHALVARGHTVHVMAPKQDKGVTSCHTVDGIVEHRMRSHKVVTHPYMRLNFPWEIYSEADKIIRQIQPDVIHIQCHYIIGRVLARLGRKRGIRVIATNHVMPENITPFLPFNERINALLEKASWKDMRRVLKQAAVVTTPTQIGAAAMENAGKFQRPVLPVSNGIQSSDYELAPGETVEKNPGELSIFFAGRLAVEKNIDVLIEGFSKLPQELRERTVLEIAGTGEILNQLQDKAHACGVSDRVRFLGYVSDEELRAGYLRCDVFCQPGTAELQSLVTLEAMSASKPVVLANALALPHLVEQGKNGFLFEPGNTDELAGYLAHILELPEQDRLAMGEYSHQMVTRHAADKTWETFESLYRSDELYRQFVEHRG
ncbi:MAG TPA: glycosyltransferase [Candidatus Rothia avistercoris]|uniref:D-inositol 3-phosphate glycosyltransferase n=1 Tax=Candidatus Rothia avistercoris TaxID=2840479 RepID=A0A9D2UGK5_9MICC|nr:glycosyltransferase [Candidatus Rothia avistercoris]